MKSVTLKISIILTFISCINQSKKPMDKLQQQLNSETYGSLFLSSNQKVDSLWNQYQEALFVNLIKCETCSFKSRFLASEIIFHKKTFLPEKEMLPVLGKIYANTLKRSGISNNQDLLVANGWGFLYEEDDVGFIGKRIILIGEPIIPYLYDLLDNTDEVFYQGSEDATIGNSYQYRIKDIAAFYIAKIKNIPITYYKDFEDRDKEIERLKAMLKTD